MRRKKPRADETAQGSFSNSCDGVLAAGSAFGAAGGAGRERHAGIAIGDAVITGHRVPYHGTLDIARAATKASASFGKRIGGETNGSNGCEECDWLEER